MPTHPNIGTSPSSSRSRRRFLRIGAALVAAALVAAACGGDDDDDATTATTTAGTAASSSETSAAVTTGGATATAPSGSTGGAPEVTAADGDFSDLKVVMILDGSLDDGGWNAAHARGGKDIETAFPGSTVEYVESIAPGQTATNAFEDAVASGADVVIGTTFYQDDMMDVAADNPDVAFLTWAGDQVTDNVGQFDAASEDGRYLDGIVAGSLTESNIIGYAAGFPFNEVNRAIDAFTMGARSVNPDATVKVVYLNTWYDPAVEQQAAEALVNAGADVLAHEVGAQVYATVAAKDGGHVIGYTNDWSNIEPQAWASSFLFNWGPYYVDQIKAILAGDWTPTTTFGGLADGFITFAPYGPDVTPEILAKVEQRKQEIADGSFDMFAGPITDNTGKVVIAEGDTVPFDERIGCCQWLAEGVEGSIPQ